MTTSRPNIREHIDAAVSHLRSAANDTITSVSQLAGEATGHVRQAVNGAVISHGEACYRKAIEQGHPEPHALAIAQFITDNNILYSPQTGSNPEGPEQRK